MVWIDRLNIQIQDTDAKHERFYASRSTQSSLYKYIYRERELGYGAMDMFFIFKVQIVDLNYTKWFSYEYLDVDPFLYIF
jgi:hypothetical protein